MIHYVAKEVSHSDYYVPLHVSVVELSKLGSTLLPSNFQELVFQERKIHYVLLVSTNRWLR